MMFCLTSCQSGSQIWFPVVGETLSAKFHPRQLASPVILRWASVGPLLWVVWAKNWTELVYDDMYWLSGGCGFEIPLEVCHMTGPRRLGENLWVWDQFLFLKQSDQFPITVPACVERGFIFFPLRCLCFILNKIALNFPDALQGWEHRTC